MGCRPFGLKESDMIEQLTHTHTHTHTQSIKVLIAKEVISIQGKTKKCVG